MLYSTLEDLVLKFKSLLLGAEAMATVVCDVNTSNTETVSNFELLLATPTKTPERHLHICCSGAFNFEQISYLVLVFLLITSVK